ncbi:MAG: hypothetical protein ACRC6L_07915, partial [Steroidobacteraceae bacterium]
MRILAAAILMVGAPGPLSTAAQAFTAEQAAAGSDAYGRYCSECHHSSLRGSAHGAPLTGPAFVGRWNDRSSTDLYQYIRTRMSATVPVAAGDDVYLGLVAHVLKVNGATAGSVPLAADARLPIGNALGNGSAAAGRSGPPATPAAAGSSATWEGAGGSAEAAARAGRWTNLETKPLAPVTTDLLRSPPDSDWLSWRRTLDGSGHSPLRQINRDNVGGLRLAWALVMREGSNQI